MSKLEKEQSVLEGLDQIEWHTLEHAYGEADDVPTLLRDLASHDEEIRGTALGKLFLSISHQGTVYSDSAYAAPFLIKLLRSEATQDKEGLLLLLASLARGDAYHRQHLRMYPETRRQDPAFKRELAEQIVWVERTREAVHQGLDTYQELLSHAEPKIRMNAAYTLARFKEDAPATVSLLCALLEREDDQRAKASMMLSLGFLGEPTAENLALLEAILRAEGAEAGNALIYLVAATALTWIAGDETPEEAVHVLVDMLTRSKPTSLFDVYVELPWVDGSLARFAGRTLRRQLSRERLRSWMPMTWERSSRRCCMWPSAAKSLQNRSWCSS
jgi:HEAT repeats